MDRVGISPLSALRLLLVSGLFVVIWLIFGAGSAQAAETTPAGGAAGQPQPAAAGGLLPSIAGPVTSLVTPAHTPAPPVPSASAPALPAPALPAPVLRNPVATAPLTDAVSSALAPVAGLARQVTEAVPALPGAIAAPVVAPLAQLVPVTRVVTDAIQPVAGPVNRLTGSALSLVPPFEQPLVGDPLTGVIAPPVASLPSAGAGETPVSGTAEGALPPRQPATEGSGGVPAATLPASFPVSTARPGQGPAMTVAGQGTPLQNPAPAPGGVDPFALPAPLSNAGGQGQSGAGSPDPTGQGAVADLGYRVVLPVTRGGLGSLFSFVLPGTPGQETGFSPD